MNIQFLAYLLYGVALNYPILLKAGIVAPKIFTLIVDEGKCQFFYQRLRFFPQCHSFNSDFHPILYDGYVKSNIENIYHKTKNQIDAVEGLNVLITDAFVISDLDEKQFYLPINEEFLQYKMYSLHPETDEIDVILSKISKLTRELDDPVERILKATVLMIEPCIYRDKINATVDDLLLFVDDLLKYEEEIRDSLSIADNFLNSLELWQSKTLFKNVVNLDDIEEIITTNLSEDNYRFYIFYNKKYIFLSSLFFKQIVNDMSKIIPINIIKNSLVDAGIIVPDGKSFVSKVSINTGTGQLRPRMMRLSKEALDKPGCLGFVDACVIRKE